MSEGNPVPKVEAPAPPPQKVKKVVRIVEVPAAAAPGDGAKKKSGSVAGSVLGVLGGLAIGGALALGAWSLFKNRQRVSEFLFPSSGDQPATSHTEK